MAKGFKEKISQGRSKEGVIDAVLGVGKPVEKKDYTVQVKKKETRNRRLQLLMTQSLYNRVEAQAKSLEISVNELINTVLDDVIDK